MIHKLNVLLITIVSIPLMVVAPITTLVFGLLAAVTLGILGIIPHWIKNIVFTLPTLLFSKLYESGNIIGAVLSILGIPFSLGGSIISTLIGHGGDMEMRVYEKLLYESFPYSYSFDKYAKNKVELYELDQEKQDILYGLLETHRSLSPKLDTFRDKFNR